jgi:hypothetical protein
MDIGGNPSAVYDHQKGKLVLQFVRGLLNKHTQAQTCNPATTNWQIESTDSGLTWSKPVEITKYLGQWAGSLVGPANGIQLRRNKEHGNRLVWCGHWGVYNSTQVWHTIDCTVDRMLGYVIAKMFPPCISGQVSTVCSTLFPVLFDRYGTR